MLKMPCGSGKSQIGKVNRATGWVCVLVWVEKTRRMSVPWLGWVSMSRPTDQGAEGFSLP